MVLIRKLLSFLIDQLSLIFMQLPVKLITRLTNVTAHIDTCISTYSPSGNTTDDGRYSALNDFVLTVG